MKTTVTLLILFALFSLNSFAQDSPQWGLPEGATARLGKGAIQEVTYSPEGTRLAVASSIGIWLYDTATHQEVALLTGHTSDVNSVAFSPNGRTIASGSGDDTIRLWDAGTGEHLQTLTGHTSDVNSIAFSPNGRTIASGSGGGTIRLWDADTGAHLQTLTGHTDWVNSVAFSPNGRTLASTSGSWQEIRLWDANTGEHLQTLAGDTSGVNSVAYSPDGRTIAGGSRDNTIRLWDANTGEHLQTLTGHTSDVNSVAYSPDGRTIASGSGDTWSWSSSDEEDHTVRLWDADTGELLRTLTGHTSDVNSVANSPDGRTIASGSDDDTIRLWDADNGRHLRTLTGHTHYVFSVAFSSDGRTIASGSWDYTVRLWDADTGEHLQTLTGHTSGVVSVAFSPNGRTIAGGSWDDTVRLWDADTGEHLQTLTGHTSGVNSVAFSPNGRTIASGSSDGTALLWELTPSADTNATVSFLPSSVQSPAIGDQLTLSLNITDGENVAGYQATVTFDTDALRYVSSANADYLPQGAFAVPAVVPGNTVTLAATSLAGESNGDGTLATLTFEVVAVKASTLTLSDVVLSDSAGAASRPHVESGEVVEPPRVAGDVNGDGAVNIQDLVLVAARFGQSGLNNADVNGDSVVNIQDLVLVATAFGNAAAAPSAHARRIAAGMPLLRAADVNQWLTQARQLDLTDATSQRGILFLEQLLAALTPKATALLPNYPNPFNPETWIPYHLAHDADVTLTIYDAKGATVRQLDLGHQLAGFYTDRVKAAYWDGTNEFGERVATGIYFYQLQADNISFLRNMVILK